MGSLLINHRSNSRSDHRVARLEAKYGMAGYGLYWAIVEHLANNDNAIDADIETLAYMFRCSEEMVSFVVNSSGLFVVEDGILSCELLIEQQDKRRKLADNARKRWKKQKEQPQEKPVEPEQPNETEQPAETFEPEAPGPKAEQPKEPTEEKQPEQQEEKIEVNHDNRINYKEFAEQWNSICTNLPKVEKLTESRKRKIKARLNDWPKEKIFEAFAKINANDFLCGKNNRGWTATFDWAIENDRNIAKVLEGAYSTSIKQNSQPVQKQLLSQPKTHIIHVSHTPEEYDEAYRRYEEEKKKREEELEQARQKSREILEQLQQRKQEREQQNQTAKSVVGNLAPVTVVTKKLQEPTLTFEEFKKLQKEGKI